MTNELEIILSYLDEYTPYVLLALNFLFNVLTYKRTGKVVGFSKDNPLQKLNNKSTEDITNEDVSSLLAYHKEQVKNLEDYLSFKK